ncbi:hypothetical protein BBW65_05760 [Helicobacter enhydrae]|uniref:Uncharacterized protein n=1 Tax=Helicobacter enhydrae TaxID=222136 RepID=A0A1B1U6M1_9HELI|nr:hypothetical protein BBW65_05760 [Helicobacter enhydrae]
MIYLSFFDQKSISKDRQFGLANFNPNTELFVHFLRIFQGFSIFDFSKKTAKKMQFPRANRFFQKKKYRQITYI